MLLELRSIWYRYPGSDSYALRDVSLDLRRSEALLLTGPNGAGKTTLLLVAAGLLKPLRGEVLLDGKPLREQLPDARRHIGLLFQNPEAMLFNPTVMDEISYVPRQLLQPKEALNAASDTARLLGIPRELLNRPIHALSYGEKKLVALASILSYKPRILLLDEPLTNLHSRYASRLMEILRTHLKLGGGALIASHEAGRYQGLVDRVLCMEDGVLREACSG